MFIDIKYLNLLSTRLEKFKQKGKMLWNFRCPVCGDSQRNKNKARGFVFEVKGTLIYKCHNCGVSKPLDKLIQDLDPVLYKQFRLEKFSSPKKRNDQNLIAKIKKAPKPVFKVTIFDSLDRIDDLNNSHPAREYLLNRRLPTDALYYTEKFQAWVNSIKPDTFPEDSQDEPRIIIPFIDKEGTAFGFQGRALSNTSLRYITILLDEGFPKIFGLDAVNYEKRIFITEGPFDSLLVDNAIAMAGADVHLPEYLGRCDLVYVLDNEPRNPEIVNRLQNLVDKGEKVVIWPSHVKEKDINDMVIAGINVQNMIESNTYGSLTAKLKLQDWKQ